MNKIILLLLIGLVLIVILITLKLYSVNHFRVNKELPLEIEFTKPYNVCNLLYKTDYFYHFTDYDYKARNIKKSRSELVSHYCKNIVPFTDTEKENITQLIESMIKLLEGKNAKGIYLLKTWKFAKYKDIIENGYPHTHGDILFLPQWYVNGINSKSNLNKNMNIIKILIHEKIHILQRLNKVDFNTLYTKYWNFTKVDSIRNIKTISKLIRNNPDVESNNYLFKLNENKYILPVSIFNKDYEDISNLEEVEYVGVYVKKENNRYSISIPIKMEKLNNIEKYYRFFGKTDNHYHPNELSAELISDYYLNYINSNNKSIPKGAKLLAEWFEKVL